MADSVRISAYRGNWPTEYRGLAERLRGVSPSGAVFHHIGATAVPELAAKDVIDIQVDVRSLSEVDAGHFGRAGFIEFEGVSDHCPAGANVPPWELAKRLFRHEGRPAHIHVREQGRFNWRQALLCRDYLRTHREVALPYALIKLRLAARPSAGPEYYDDIKDSVFDIIATAAEAWAVQDGWHIPHGD